MRSLPAAGRAPEAYLKLEGRVYATSSSLGVGRGGRARRRWFRVCMGATSTTRTCSSSSARCCSKRRAIARRSTRSARRSTPTPRSIAVQARIGVVKSALRLGEFIEAQKEANTLKQQDPRSADVLAVHADALWSAGLFDEAHQEFKDALALVPDLSRGHHGLARALASQNKLDEALNEAQARAQAVAARRGNPPHRRLDLRAHAPLRAGRRGLRQLRQPAAEQGSQRQGGVVAIADPLPALVRRARADRDRRERGGRPAHRGLPHRRRQGDRQGARQRRPPAGLRARHRLGADDDFAPDGVERRACARSPTR